MKEEITLRIKLANGESFTCDTNRPFQNAVEDIFSHPIMMIRDVAVNPIQIVSIHKVEERPTVVPMKRSGEKS